MITKENYRGWPNTYLVDNGLVRARVVTDVGPRILSFGASSGENLLQERDGIGGSGEANYVFRGGWRLWVAPERRETTYALDNQSCTVERLSDRSLRVTGPPQPEAGIQKIVTIEVEANVPRLKIDSRIRALSPGKPLTYAAWSLPVLRPGGRAFVPLDVGPLDAFDSTRSLIFWSYARFDDPRYRISDRLVEIDHRRVVAAAEKADGRRPDESKIGVDSKQGWSAYLVGETLFLKRFPYDEGTYGDGGSTIEVYSNRDFLELEHLGPLRSLAANEEIRLTEEWWIFDGVKLPDDLGAALERLHGYLRQAGRNDL